MFIRVFLLLMSLASCGRPEPPVSQEAADSSTKEETTVPEVVRLSPEALRSLSLKTAAVERRPLTEEVRVTAVIKPNENRLAHVSPRIPGRVVSVSKFLGDTVKEGDILAALDSVELGKAKADYLKFQALVGIQEKNYQRAKRLFEQHIASQKEMLEAEAAYLTVKAEFEAAHATLHLYGLSNEETHQLTWQAKEPISQFPLLSPFPGIVAEKDLTIGEMVSPERSVYTIADLSTVWIQLDVYEKDLAKVHPGQEVILTTESYPEERFRGAVTYIGVLFNEQTRTVPTRVEIPNQQGRLKPGMFATAIIMAQEGSGATGLIIPESALQQVEADTVVFIPDGDGVFTKRKVTIGNRGEGWVEVSDGVREGEQVVTEGIFTLKSELLKDALAGEE
jgi:cobalt-zinc-cadmium efflux system membrane fusion protein